MSIPEYKGMSWSCACGINGLKYIILGQTAYMLRNLFEKIPSVRLLYYTVLLSQNDMLLIRLCYLDVKLRGSIHVNHTRFIVVPKFRLETTQSHELYESRTMYPKSATSSTSGCLVSKIVLFLESRGSHSSYTCLKDSEAFPLNLQNISLEDCQPSSCIDLLDVDHPIPQSGPRPVRGVSISLSCQFVCFIVSLKPSVPEYPRQCHCGIKRRVLKSFVRSKPNINVNIYLFQRLLNCDTCIQ